jgi:hypothetical protein
MVTIRRFFILALTAFLAAGMAMGQSANTEEMSVEESYLQEAIELMIIRETSRADSREQKMVALDYISNAIDRGSTNTELRTTLEYLSLEGIQNKTRENGRLVNDYPDVRRQSVKYLGKIGTNEAKTALIKICTTDNEPMVLQEAVKSLGDIGLNDNDETVNAIVWIANRYNNTSSPDNLLALASVDSLDKIAQKYHGLNPNAVQLLIKIAEGYYAPPVKERAKQVLMDLRKYMAQGKKQEQEQQEQQKQ